MRSFSFTGALMACLLWPEAALADKILLPQRATSGADEHFSLNGEYDHFLGAGWFNYAATRFQGAHLDDMDQRSVREIGSGYRIVDVERLQLSFRAGIDVAHAASAPGTPYDDRGIHWGFDLEHAVVSQPLNFFYSQRGILGLDGGDHRTININTGLRIPLASGLSASAGYDREWDLSSEENSTDAEPTYTFGVGYDW